ncbi:MAG: GldM C-terminal domain [Bacteroidota bacterium]|jgi:hypothetical protein
MFQKISSRLNVEHFVLLAVVFALLVLFCENRIGKVHTVFLDLDKTLIQNRLSIEKENKKLFLLIGEQRAKYPNPITLNTYQDAKKTIELCNTLHLHLDSLRTNLIDFVEGNASTTSLVHFEEQAGVRRFFETQYDLNTLAKKTNQLQDSLLLQIKDKRERLDIVKQFQLDLYKKDSFSYSTMYPSCNFKHISLAGALAVLSNLQMQVAATETVMLNYYSDRVNIIDCGYHSYSLYIKPQPYLSFIQGKKIRFDLFMRAYSTNPGSIEMNINGIPQPVKDGIVHYVKRGKTIGTENINIEVFKKVWDETFSNQVRKCIATQHYEYEVLPPMIQLTTKYKLPAPTIKLGGTQSDGTLAASAFQQYHDLQAAIEEGDVKNNYTIQHFTCIYLSKEKDPITIYNKGATFNSQLIDLQRTATSGDTFLLTEIEGVNKKEALNSLVVHIE